MALMPVAEALARVLADAEPLAAEATPLADAYGRVLAADVAALRTQPPADVSAMDGYAVRSADVARVPVKLKVIGEVAAGHPFHGTVGAGEAGSPQHVALFGVAGKHDVERFCRHHHTAFRGGHAFGCGFFRHVDHACLAAAV